MGSSILIAGVVTALLTAPLFDRVFTKHLGLTVKVIVPVISLAWLGLVWASTRYSSSARRLEIDLTLVCS